jgi:hypothetical protein
MPNITEGPFVQAACLCETVLIDTTGTASLIRIVDTLTHHEPGPTPPKEMPAFTHTLKLVLMLKSGNAKGSHELRVVPELPNGATENAIILTAYFDGEEKGQNIIGDMAFLYKMEGLYWFNIYLEDSKLTAIPLRIKYDRTFVAGAIPPALP